jgi:hypothetical protein
MNPALSSGKFSSSAFVPAAVLFSKYFFNAVSVSEETSFDTHGVPPSLCKVRHILNEREKALLQKF